MSVKRWLVIVGISGLTLQAQPAVQEWLVAVRTDECFTQVQSLLATHGFSPADIQWERLTRHWFFYRLRLPVMPAAGKEQIQQLLDAIPCVSAVQENRSLQLRFQPSDPYYPNQWHLWDTNGIDASRGWDLLLPYLPIDTVVVAVIDAGFDTLQPDVHWALNPLDTPDGIDNDLNGYVDDHRGWNAEDSTGVLPYHQHGQMIAGIIGGITDNDTGISGVGWRLPVLPIVGVRDEASLLQAYDYILTQRRLWDTTGGQRGLPIYVTSLSMGIDYAQPQDHPLWCAVYDSLGKYGILNIAATTNAIVDVDAVGDVPTACPSPYLISVTATDRQGNLVGGYGAAHIDIAAPGVDIWSTWNQSVYSYGTGTSYAAPQIAAIAGLVFHLMPDSLRQQYASHPDSAVLWVRHVVLTGRKPISTLKNKVASGGIGNLYYALHITLTGDTSIVNGVRYPSLSRSRSLHCYTLTGQPCTDHSAYPTIQIYPGQKIIRMPFGPPAAVPSNGQ